MQMFAKVNHVVNLKGKKPITSILIDEKGFHSLIFVLDEGSWSSSMLVSRMTNLQKCTTRLCLPTGQFFRAAEETFTQHNIEYGLSEIVVSTSNSMYQWALDGIEIS